MTTTTGTTAPLCDGDHVVQFYDDDRELETTAFARLAGAAGSGDAVVVIGTSEHLAACRRVFVGAGVDMDRALAEGQVRLLDATEVLDAFIVQGRVDRGAFDRSVGDVIRAAGETGRRVHAFGEMVGLLWAEGDVAGAIELEELWDELGVQLEFSLHCGYPAALMATPSTAQAFEAVCDLHSEVAGGAPAPDAQVTRHFVKDSRSLEQARRLVADTVTTWGLTELLEDARLVVSELATNAIRHGASPFTVSLSPTGSGLHLVVGDRSSSLPQRREPDVARCGGRGLQLVDAITARWGCDLVDGGKLVWADLLPVIA